MQHFFAVDPGGTCLGWAEFKDGRLVAAGLSRTKEKTPQARAQHHRAFLASMGAYDGVPVVCECMRYRPGRNVGNPQDLIELNLIAGHVGTEWKEPHQWKGMQSKEVHQPLILAELSDSERKQVPTKPKSLVHNAVDAVGIGLYALERMRPCGRVDVAKLVTSSTRRTRTSKPRRAAGVATPRGAKGSTRRTKTGSKATKRGLRERLLARLPKGGLVAVSTG